MTTALVPWPNKFRDSDQVDLNVPFLSPFQQQVIITIARERASYMCNGPEFFVVTDTTPRSPVPFSLVWYDKEDRLRLTTIAPDRVEREIALPKP